MHKTTMRQMVFSTLLLTTLVYSAPPAAPGKSGMDAERVARIKTRMQAFVDRGDVAGVVTLVARHGVVASHEAVGVQDVETRKPMRPDSIFQIMSMTKPMVATAIMMLAEEGRLGLNDPVERHLPEFRGQMVVDSRTATTLALRRPTRPITIRDLMSHTSGMGGPLPAGIAELYQTMDRTLAGAVAIFAGQPLEFDPGSRWLYSNMGIATLGRIIEVASGAAFEKFMQDRLWTPLGMKDTFLFPPSDKLDRICAVHQIKDGKLARAGADTLGGDALQYRKGAQYPAPEFGAYSTASDLLAFYEMTRNGGLHNGKRLLSSASVSVMTSLHTGDLKAGHMPGTGFGLAWEVVKEPLGTLNFLSIGAYGHGGAFGTHGWIDREKDLVGVFLIQQSGGAGTDVKYAFMRLAGAALAE
ncbi:MAG: beta-lactamase family protein [Acidobacteriia bacterium]|nr:beta-lactamase family protein [Terriglobia bacterium]